MGFAFHWRTGSLEPDWLEKVDGYARDGRDITGIGTSNPSMPGLSTVTERCDCTWLVNPLDSIVESSKYSDVRAFPDNAIQVSGMALVAIAHYEGALASGGKRYLVAQVHHLPAAHGDYLHLSQVDNLGVSGAESLVGAQLRVIELDVPKRQRSGELCRNPAHEWVDDTGLEHDSRRLERQLDIFRPETEAALASRPKVRGEQ